MLLNGFEWMFLSNNFKKNIIKILVGYSCCTLKYFVCVFAATLYISSSTLYYNWWHLTTDCQRNSLINISARASMKKWRNLRISQNWTKTWRSQHWWFLVSYRKGVKSGEPSVSHKVSKSGQPWRTIWKIISKFYQICIALINVNVFWKGGESVNQL